MHSPRRKGVDLKWITITAWGSISNLLLGSAHTFKTNLYENLADLHGVHGEAVRHLQGKLGRDVLNEVLDRFHFFLKILFVLNEF